MSTITYTAADELDRRIANRALKAQGKRPIAAPATDEGKRLFGMSSSDLKEEAGLNTPAPTPVAPTTTTRRRRTATTTTTPELTPFQKAVNADPAKYGVGFGGKRKARGLPSLTAEQRANRKALYAEQNPATV